MAEAVEGAVEGPAELSERIRAARGEIPAELVFRGGTLVDVLAGETRESDVAVHGGRVVGLGPDYEALREVDCTARWIAPGFLDGHMHVESSLVTLPEFARAVLPRGTVGAVLDPHEIANVHGVEGIRYVLESRRGVPFHAFVMASSCVPATHLETSGAELGAEDLAPLFEEEGVVGLAEMMNFPGVVHGDPQVLSKLEAARQRDVVVDGHCPGLTGRELNAYATAGPGSDHEATRLEEAREKLRTGMRVMIREASTARNLDELLPLVTPENERRCSFVTDDRHPHDLLTQGHLDHMIRRAIASGLAPVTAYRMASLNNAEWFGLDRRGYGAVAPGRRADLVVLDDLERASVERTYVGGRLVALEGEVVVDVPESPSTLPESVHVELDRFPGFGIPVPDAPDPDGREAPAGAGSGVVDGGASGAADGDASHGSGGDGSRAGRVKVIEVVPGQILTERSVAQPRIEDGEAVADPGRDLLKLAVVERHGKNGNVGLGFVRGFGMDGGALGSSVAHDNHNVVICGASDADMRMALEEIVRMQGGLVAVRDGRVRARLPLPIAGLMSDRPLPEVRDALDELHRAYHEMGGELEGPFMALSFLALAVIPTLKLTDRGLVDVEAFELVDLWEA